MTAPFAASLWFGEAISDDEKVALRKIAAAVGVRFDEISSAR